MRIGSRKIFYPTYIVLLIIFLLSGCGERATRVCGEFPLSLTGKESNNAVSAVGSFLDKRNANLKCGLEHFRENFARVSESHLDEDFFYRVSGYGLEILYPRSHALTEYIQGPYGVYLSENEKEFLRRLVSQSNDEMRPLAESVMGQVEAFVNSDRHWPNHFITDHEFIVTSLVTADPSIDWILSFSQAEFDYLFTSFRKHIGYSESASNESPALGWEDYCAGAHFDMSTSERISFRESIDSAISDLQILTSIPDNAFIRKGDLADQALLKQTLWFVPFGYVNPWLDDSGINGHRSFIAKTIPKVVSAFERVCPPQT